MHHFGLVLRVSSQSITSLFPLEKNRFSKWSKGYQGSQSQNWRHSRVQKRFEWAVQGSSESFKEIHLPKSLKYFRSCKNLSRSWKILDPSWKIRPNYFLGEFQWLLHFKGYLTYFAIKATFKWTKSIFFAKYVTLSTFVLIYADPLFKARDQPPTPFMIRVLWF